MVVLALLECGARWLDPRLPLWMGKDHQAVVMTGHPVRLWGLGEGTRKNATTTATISSLGIREPVPVVPRPAEKERILVLGDSTFFGFGVDDQATLASHLHRLDPTKVDTVNASIPGYSTQQARLLMDDVGWDTQPSLVLIGCFWSDAKRAPYPDQDLLNSLAARRSPLLRDSALVRLIAGRLRVGGIVSWTRFDKLPGPSLRRVPILDYASNLDALVREAAVRGIGAALITPPEIIVITSAAKPPHQWEPYLRAQAAVAAHHGIPHIQTTASFLAHYEQAVAASLKPTEEAQQDARRQLFLDDLHPSALGQQIMAQTTMDALREVGWPEARMLGVEKGVMALEGLVDDDQRGEQGTSPRVPMANLFPHSQSSGQGTQPEPVHARQGDAPGGDSSPWTVEGDARVGHKGTCRIQILDAEGRKVSAAFLRKSGTYRLQVPASVSRVKVVLTGSDCTAQGTAIRADGGRVQLSPGAP